MPVPRPDHIQRQIDAGKAAFEAIQRGEDPDAIEVRQVLEAPPAEPYVGPDIQAQGGEPEAPPQGDPPSEQPPAEEPPPPSEGAPEGEPEAGDPLARAKHATATWKGRAQAARAETAKLTRQVEDLTALTTRQMEAMAELQARVAALPQAPAVPAGTTPAPAAATTTPDERRQYGEEFSDYMERLAVQAVSRQLDEMRNGISKITGAVETVDRRTRKQIVDDFYRDLSSKVPNYEAVDQDPEWVLWLAQRDPFSGDTRKNLFVKACEMADSDRAARFFQGFLAEQAATDPEPTSPTPGNGNAAGSQVLERMASPGRPRQPASREAPAPEKITGDQIKTFYTDVTKGHYRNKPAEKAARIAQIEAALMRGDITLQ